MDEMKKLGAEFWSKSTLHQSKHFRSDQLMSASGELPILRKGHHAYTY